MRAQKKLLVVDVAALGWDLVSRAGPAAAGFGFRRLQPVFPALTCTAQASFRTATRPCDHGMIGNGLFFRELRRVMFWEQSAGLVAGARLWRRFRRAGRRVGMMFWQQSLGEDLDLVLSPRPVHKHHGGMIQDCYSQPADLYDRLIRAIGAPFNLIHYWGPLASAKSSEWIVEALAHVMNSPDLAPDLLLGYLPHLDYDLQRHGPDSPAAARALEQTLRHLARLRDECERAGYEFVFFGDYAIEPVTGPPVFPNRALREAGLLAVRPVRGRLYPDFFSSGAFALADHQVAHVFTDGGSGEARLEKVLRDMEGVAEVMDRGRQAELGLGPARTGEYVLLADKGRWFAYPWWDSPRQAPDYAGHVDIHNKPGYDPCELFFGWPPGRVSSNPARIRGTHGRPGVAAAWAASFPIDPGPADLLDLARAVAWRLDQALNP
ncbi:MAG: alkaline phosphatase family protein [Kiritimatiellae bacterium]|nr:alkaline phosphatase family protein [Kiritimatiellia bacterium]